MTYTIKFVHFTLVSLFQNNLGCWWGCARSQRFMVATPMHTWQIQCDIVNWLTTSLWGFFEDKTFCCRIFQSPTSSCVLPWQLYYVHDWANKSVRQRRRTVEITGVASSKATQIKYQSVWRVFSIPNVIFDICCQIINICTVSQKTSTFLFCMHKPTNESWSQAKNLLTLTCFAAQNPKKTSKRWFE